MQSLGRLLDAAGRRSCSCRIVGVSRTTCHRMSVYSGACAAPVTNDEEVRQRRQLACTPGLL